MEKKLFYQAPGLTVLEIAVESGLASTGGDNEAGNGMPYDPNGEGGYII